jgi:hypothetical protein
MGTDHIDISDEVRSCFRMWPISFSYRAADGKAMTDSKQTREPIPRFDLRPCSGPTNDGSLDERLDSTLPAWFETFAR